MFTNSLTAPSAVSAGNANGYAIDPTWLPHSYDAPSDSFVFARVPVETRKQVVFLDRRFLAQAPQSPPVPVNLLRAADIETGPVHFIFHTAFCCSTLMTRALDVPGVAAGLKEPGVLVSFAKHWSNARQTPGALNALKMTLDLLSRPGARGETQIIKASNVATHLLPEILHLRPDAKVLVMYSSLGGFLEAVTRRDIGGRSFARQVYQGFSNSIPLDIALSSEEQMLQTDMQIAALVWLMQASFFNQMQRYYGPDRIRTLSSNRFLASPAEALANTSAFFGLNASRAQWDAVAEGDVFQEHAKERGLPFDTAKHKAQLAQARAAHARELEVAEDWAKQIAARCGAPLSLDDTLMSPVA
ncbi:MAG: hypothetical protein ABL871_15480 [Terricaulis sp.]